MKRSDESSAFSFTSICFLSTDPTEVPAGNPTDIYTGRRPSGLSTLFQLKSPGMKRPPPFFRALAEFSVILQNKKRKWIALCEE